VAVRDSDRRAPWRWYRRFYRSSYPSLLLSVVISIVQSLLLLPIGILVGRIFDVVLPAGDIRGLVATCGAVLALYLTSGALALGTRHITLRTTKIAIMALREELIGKLYTLPRSFHDEADNAHLHTVVVQDSERVDVMSNGLVALMIPAALTGALLSVVLVLLDLRLFLVMVAVGPVLYLLRAALGRRVRHRVRAFHESFEGFSRGVMRALRTLDLTRTRAAENFERTRHRGRLDDLRRVSGSMAWLASAYSFVQSTVATGSGAVVLVFGGTAVAAGQMTLGRLIAFYVVMGLLQIQVRTVSFNIQPVIEGAEALGRLYELSHEHAPPPYAGTEKIAFEGGIELRGVSFGYPRQPVLHEIDLTVQPGKVVALVGGNGAGKSTVANLVLGFYRPATGTLTADGVPYEGLDLAHLRRQTGALHQDPLIFPGDIENNIAYDRTGIGMPAIESAARLATADRFISGLPDGLATRVGEDGHLLSSGERQRIALARAVLGDPPLLILDEPSSNLDEEARRRLLANLLALDPRPAMLLITHDPDYVLAADTVCVLRDGRIQASGSPAELAAAGVLSPIVDAVRSSERAAGSR
jgi:ABC-type multidrug transport system fused ATPase/permease subunit